MRISFICNLSNPESAMPVTKRETQELFSYGDYMQWPDGERWEIIAGQAYSMSPSPSVKHQRIVSNFDFQFHCGSKDKCSHFIAPMDVVLDEFNVVQPDIFVVCDSDKITPENIQGTPDLIVEVVSPSTEIKDRREKKNLYEKFGVREYIIVFPEREYLERYELVNQAYGAPEIFNWDETLTLMTFPGFTIKLWEIFEREPDLQEGDAKK